MIRKNQKGASLLEMILVLALIAIISLGLIRMIGQQVDGIKDQITSAKMTRLLNVTENYVLDNFGDLKAELTDARCDMDSSNLGGGCLSKEDKDALELEGRSILTSAAISINLSALQNDGYLGSNFDTKTPYGGDLAIVIAFVGYDDIIQVMIVNNDINNMNNKKQIEIAYGIQSGHGGIWYGTGDMCDNPEESCVKSVKNTWEMKHPDVIFANLTNALGDPLFITEDAILAIAAKFVDGRNEVSQSLYKNKIRNNRTLNEVKGDLIFSTKDSNGFNNFDSDGDDINDEARSSIFFNASSGYDEFTGNALTYRQKYDENGVELTGAILSLENTGDIDKSAQFSAKGGFISDKTATLDEACVVDTALFSEDGVISDLGVMAKDTGGLGLLKCIVDENDPTIGIWKEIGDIDVFVSVDPALDLNITQHLSGGSSEPNVEIIENDLKSISYDEDHIYYEGEAVIEFDLSTRINYQNPSAIVLEFYFRNKASEVWDCPTGSIPETYIDPADGLQKIRCMDGATQASAVPSSVDAYYNIQLQSYDYISEEYNNMVEIDKDSGNDAKSLHHTLDYLMAQIKDGRFRLRYKYLGSGLDGSLDLSLKVVGYIK